MGSAGANHLFVGKDAKRQPGHLELDGAIPAAFALNVDLPPNGATAMHDVSSRTSVFCRQND